MLSKSYIIVTGGAGYIGKHIVVDILRAGYRCLVIDSLATSSYFSREEIGKLVKDIDIDNSLDFYKVDIRDLNKLDNIFYKYFGKISLIIHLAALKSIPESLEKPELYYDVNVNGTKNLINLSKKYKIKKFVFSSTAAVYKNIPPKTGYLESDVEEVDKLEHAYAKTKRQCEIMLIKEQTLEDENLYVILRYFNPIGNHISGVIGEDLLKGNSSGLMFSLGKTILGKYKNFKINGNNYENSQDGTAMRDFIDVNDLADAHLKIIHTLSKLGKTGIYCYNIGTGYPTSVGKLVNTMISLLDKSDKLKVTYGERRDGDQEISYADTSKVRDEIGWVSKINLEQSCQNFINRCQFLAKPS